MREATLFSSAIYVSSFDSITEDEKSKHLQKVLETCIEEFSSITILSGEKEWFPIDMFANSRFVSLKLSLPNAIARKNLWVLLSKKNGYRLEDDIDFGLLASKFLFTRAKIERSLNYARNIAAAHQGNEKYKIRMAELYEGCRAQSSQKLLSMARKVKPIYTWKDIVLPKDNKEQLREICSNVKHRILVYDRWGFEKKLSLGKGLNILFSGPTGTGKTMAAEVIANELQLEMYKIDLSAVVSKWVGETEKNLTRIFAEARDMNGIIFFDEADALFGKRTGVKDAHDRYANLETSYLLQKIEEYEGIVILSSNFRENIDEAFLRRMHFKVEFQLPDDESRLSIWRNIFPIGAPISSDVDMNFLAKKFKISGGNIKNVALAAAFYAAEESSSICLRHIIKALRREYLKIGRLPSEADFGNTK
jgi:SpoVK/Ycf46/Vps4 family AAA+-type ATPase